MSRVPPMRLLRAVITDQQTATVLRLVLEPQTAAHALALFPVLCDPAIYRHENQPPASASGLLQRFEALEARGSPDGREQWLNWVVRTDPQPGAADDLQPQSVAPSWTGYVQATLDGSGDALLGYEFASDWWGRGIARAAVAAMLDELAASYGSRRAVAVTKRSNRRSQALLQRLDFNVVAQWPAIAGPPVADECCWTLTRSATPEPGRGSAAPARRS
ncbi:MAG: GNAT family N-acetyltransferase [Rubrivivax sp.]